MLILIKILKKTLYLLFFCYIITRYVQEGKYLKGCDLKFNHSSLFRLLREDLDNYIQVCFFLFVTAYKLLFKTV